MPWLPVTSLVILVVLGGGVLALWLLGVWSGQHASRLDADEAAATTLELEKVKIGLTVAAGLGAGVTLLVALRRQSVSERAQRFTEEDAQEQRITALYVAAVEQLGNEKAAVRLGGLYALERLGQDNPKLRQTVVEVICAYLRMPYTPPVEVLRTNAEHSPHHVARDAEVPEPDQQPERRQELQVRLAALRLLSGHTKVIHDLELETLREPDTYWRDHENNRMDIDLTGATLVDLDMRACHPGSLAFANTLVHGHAYLVGAQFHGDANLCEAQFHGDAFLVEAQFHGDAFLVGAQFHGHAYLVGAQFHGYADLCEAQFHGDANLDDLLFDGGVDLVGAQIRSSPFRLPQGWTTMPQPESEMLLVIAEESSTPLPEED